jgi:hypothetical protein
MDQIFDLMDKNPAIPIGMGIVLVFLAIVSRKGKQRTADGWGGTPTQRNQKGTGLLDFPLIWWTETDPFTIRDLLNGGLLILGRAGSGKTSGSGRCLMQALANCVMSAGLILAAKPEDEEDIKAVFRKAGRLGDLVIFDLDNRYRFNFLRYLGTGDPRNVVRCMMMIGETLQRGENGGSEEGRYWMAQCERLLETAVIALQTAGEEVTAVNLHRFITTAATMSQDLRGHRRITSKITPRVLKPKWWRGAG